MAKTGVTYEQVAAAANELTSKNRRPTLEAIRRILGTGSNSTLVKHLGVWRTTEEGTQDIVEKEKIPETLVVALKSVWEKVVEQSNHKINKVEQDAQQTIATIQQEFAQLQQANNHLQQQQHQLKQERDSLVQDKSALNHFLNDAKVELATVTEKLTGTENQNHEKQERIAELQHQHQQVQTNLEHYRESVREQRAKEQQQYEQQINQLEHTHRYLLQDNHDLKKSLAAQQAAYDQLSKDHQQLKQDSYQVKASLETRIQQVQNLTNENKDQKQQAIEQKMQYDALLAKSNQQQETIIVAQQQLELLKQKYNDKEKQCNDLSNQNQHLAHTQWELKKENMQLLTQIKQFQKMRKS